MQTQTIQNQLADLVRLMLEKELERPTAKFILEANVSYKVQLNYKKIDSLYSWDIDSHFFDTFSAALDFITALPTKAERELDAYRIKLADCIDTGTKFGIDIAFIEPVSAAMTALTTNLLTKQAPPRPDVADSDEIPF